MPTPPGHWDAPGQPVFVGRRAERTLLDRAWADAQRRIRQFVLVCGEPGAGKSRLVTEAANDFHRRGAAVLVGGCTPDFGRPYDPLAEPVRALLPWTVQGQIQLGDEVATQAEVVDRLRLVAGGDPDIAVSSTRLLFDAVTRLMVEAAGPHPLVLVLEDLHWATKTGARLVVDLAASVTDVPVLVLATLRSTTSMADEPPAFGSLYRLAGVHRLDLDPLQAADIADYLHRGHGVPPGVATARAAELREQTGGNPFLLREVCRSWPQGEPPSGTPQAPASIRATVAARCADLSAESLLVLRLAAVLGQQVSAAELGWCLAEPGEGDAGTGVLTGIDDAIGAGLLEKVPTRDGAYRFLHALTRQSVLAAVPRARPGSVACTCRRRARAAATPGAGRRLPTRSLLSRRDWPRLYECGCPTAAGGCGRRREPAGVCRRCGAVRAGGRPQVHGRTGRLAARRGAVSSPRGPVRSKP